MDDDLVIKASQYGLILYLALFLSYLVIYHLGELTLDVESTRYLVSALMQSEAAILAIVITMSLVVVQQTSSSYSTRIIDIFIDWRKNPDFYILLAIYIPAIIVDGIILRLLSRTEDPSLFGIFLAFSLATLALFGLGIYLEQSLTMFKPTTIIKLLSKNFNEDNIMNVINRDGDNNKLIQTNDPVQPIIDVIQGSMKTYDYEIANYGLMTIKTQTLNLLCNLSYQNNENKSLIASKVSRHIETVGIIASNQQMSETVIDAAKVLENLGKYMVENNLENDAVTLSLYNIGNNAVHQKLIDASNNIVSCLYEQTKLVMKNDSDYTTPLPIEHIKKIGVLSVKKEMLTVGFNSITYLEKIGIISATQENEEETKKIIDLLYDFVEPLNNKKSNDSIKQLISSLKKIGDTSIEKDSQQVVEIVLSSITRIASEDLLSQLRSGDTHNTFHAIDCIKRIGTKVAEKKQPHLTHFAIDRLESIDYSIINNNIPKASFLPIRKKLLNSI